MAEGPTTIAGVMQTTATPIREMVKPNEERPEQARPERGQVEAEIHNIPRLCEGNGEAVVRVRGWNKRKPIPAGFRSGRLLVIRQTEVRSSDKQIMYECQCDCGNTKLVRGQFIRKQITLSCGCLQSEATAKRSITHGHSVNYRSSRTYRIWTNMKDRCSNPKTPGYRYYGARGIRVCERWSAFEAFLADMGPAPDGLTLDRKDNYSGYSKENCRWATWKEQMANRRVKLKSA